MSFDFSKPQLIKLSDKNYFSIGKTDYFNHKDLVLSASLLKEAFKRDAYDVLINKGVEIDSELQYAFDVGQAFHCFTLENEYFESRFYVAEYPNTFESEHKTFIKDEDFAFIKGVYENIEIKYPYILEASEWNEVSLLTDIDSVPYKCKIDKLIEIDDEIIIIDLKSVFYDFYAKKYKRSPDGIRWGLVKEIQALDYDLQGVAYIKAIESYLQHHGISKRVTFKLLLASKETYDCKMVTFGSEMIENGLKKWDIVFPEMRAFYHYGKIQIDKDEII